MRPPSRHLWPLLAAVLSVACLGLFVGFHKLPSDLPSDRNRWLGLIADGAVPFVDRTEWGGGDKNNAIKLDEEEDEKKEPLGIVYIDEEIGGDNVTVSVSNTTASVQNGSVLQSNMSILAAKETNVSSNQAPPVVLSNEAPPVEVNQAPPARRQLAVKEKIWEMEDQLIIAKAYVRSDQWNSNSNLVRELKARIKDIERILDQTDTDSNLSQGALQKIKAMETALSRAQNTFPDCSTKESKLHAMANGIEKQLKEQQKVVSHFTGVAARTLPKGLHCLSMQLTSEYFKLKSMEHKFPTGLEAEEPDSYHYAILSDNVLASAVVVNSTITTCKEPEKIVFHVVTDSLNYPAMMMWFMLNPPSPAKIQIESLDEWLPNGFRQSLKQTDVHDPRYTSALYHLRFYLPDIFPSLSKILLLDQDVVVQRDLSELWRVDMKGKVNCAAEACGEGKPSNQLQMLLNISDPIISSSFDPTACPWAFGMNMFDLDEWRKQDLTSSYERWLQAGKSGLLWKAGSPQLDQLVFYNNTIAMGEQWIVLGLGGYLGARKEQLEKAAAIHFDGNLKPWLDIAVTNYKRYWKKFLDYGKPYLLQCNIHE